MSHRRKKRSILYVRRGLALRGINPSPLSNPQAAALLNRLLYEEAVGALTKFSQAVKGLKDSMDEATYNQFKG